MQDDPLNALVRGMHSYILGLSGQHEESVTEAERAFALDEDSFLAQWGLMQAYAWGSRYERALEVAPGLLRMSGRHPWGLGTLAWTYGKAGRPQSARAVYDEMEARSRHEFMSPFWLAVAAASAGLMDEAIVLTKRAVAERDPLVVWMRVNKFFEEIREDPRFGEVVRTVWR